MAIVPPRLDDRSFADLRAELIRRIPTHAPEWTDHNASDPGIALLELFAALGDNLLYRLNRVPEAARLEFLRLLGLQPHPPRAAEAMVRLECRRGAIAPVAVDFAVGSPRLELTAGEVHFQALEEITVLPLELRAWIKQPYSGAVLAGGVENVTSLLAAHLGAAAPDTLDQYRPLPLEAPKGGNLPLPLSSGASLDGRIWLCLAAPEASWSAALSAAGNDAAAARADLRRRLAGHVLNLGVRPDEGLCGATDHRRCPDPGADPPRWPLRWEISTGAFHGANAWVDRVRYQRLVVVADNTANLGQRGTVRLRLPDAPPSGEPFANWTADSFDPPDPDLLGVGELPPPIDDDKLAPRVLGWIRVGRADPGHPPLRLAWIELNVVRVEQAVSAAAELLGYGDGRGGQTFTLAHRPLLPGSETVQVAGTLGWENWQPVDDLALAGADDPFYLLDPIEGRVVFGDGVHGRMPLPGEAVRCLVYRHGGGVRGNVGAGRIKRVFRAAPAEALSLKADNPLPAEGGRDAETVAAASARIPALLRHNERAVAAADFADLSLDTPGVHVGRAQVLPRHKPHERIDGVPGVVTLVVLPAYDPLQPDQPTPDKEMLRRVCAHLEPRRLVTTELYVTPPQYVRLSCSVAVEPEPGSGEETLRRHVELALRQYLAPLPPYGPDGQGWPFGRAVRDRDIEAAILRVQGVRLVNAVIVVGEAIDRAGVRSAVEQTVALLPWQLPVLLEVRVAIGKDAAAEPLPALDIEPAPQPVSAMPVPVGKEEC
jgi:hypothetical protein